jgi:hypothetical protein
VKTARGVLAFGLVAAALLLAWRVGAARPGVPRPGSAVKTVSFQGAQFDVVELPLEEWAVRVDWREGGVTLADVPGGVRTNAGIFEPGFVPSGLLVSDGKELRALNQQDGEGNFYLKPNGVFGLNERGAVVLETAEFAAARPAGLRFATQSGPLLLRAGVMHPKFKKGSEHRALRSGVGVRDGRRVVLVISRDEVTLWSLAALFRDELRCPDALYLDGVISALWADGAGREADLKKGPFAGVISATRR